MIKRIFDIVNFLFYLFYLLISFPFKIVKIIIDDKIEKRIHENKKSSVKTNDNEIIDIGAILFPEQKIEFETFYNTFLNNNKRFLTENEDLLKNYEDFESDKLKPLEVLYLFGDYNHQLWMTDWRGEENEREIEQFLENKLQIKTNWKKVNEVRKKVDDKKQRDGKLMIELFKAVDKDLRTVHKHLIFLDLGWDAYVYTAVDQITYKMLTEKLGTLFHGIDKLGK